MGRRKIEIQPITHERNRSVTFVKRKNGLFKKAYELGVLCSVDVAVIIFEERPGHQRKLYQYCSSDVQNIVQQHIRHDGERDTRGPGDFRGTSSTRNDDGGDGDEDDGEEDEEDAPPLATRKRARGEGASVGKPRPTHDQDNMMNTDIDYNPRPSNNHAPSTFGIPPSIAHALSSHHSSHSSHPMSSDRLRPVQQYQHKKSKLDMHDHGGGGRGHGHNHEDPSPVSGGSEYTFPPPSSSSFRHPQYPSSSSPSTSLHQVSYGSPQYTQGPFFSNTPPQPVAPPSFMHSQGDISSSRGRSFTTPTGPTYSPPQSRSRAPTTTGSGGGTGDLLAAYLDPDPSTSRRTSSAGAGGSGSTGPSANAFGIDWPAASSSSSAPVTSPSTTTSTTSAQAGNSGSHWLDFLSGSANAPPTPTQGHAQSHSATPTPVPSNTSTSKLQTQSIGWASRAGPSTGGRNSGVRRSASGGDGSGAGVTIDVEQLFGASTAREVKKEG